MMCLKIYRNYFLDCTWNGWTVEICEGVSNFIPHLIMERGINTGSVMRFLEISSAILNDIIQFPKVIQKHWQPLNENMFIFKVRREPS